MKNALQEQLLKAGLATEQQINKANSNKSKKSHQSKKAVPKAQRKAPQDDLASAYAARRKAEQEEQAEQQRLAAQRKVNRATVRDLIKQHTLNIKDAEQVFQFVVGANVKKVYVSQAQKDALVAGKLGITFLDGNRCVLEKTLLDKISELDPEKVIFINPPPECAADDDPYASFAVPDDLEW